MSFGAQIAAFAKRTNRDADKTVRAVLVSLTNGVVLRTPVDTGRARANWQASVGSSIGGTTDKNDPSGSGAISAAQASITEAPGKVWFLANNLPYISELEYGSSQQAPGGMVRLTILEITRRIT